MSVVRSSGRINIGMIKVASVSSGLIGATFIYMSQAHSIGDGTCTNSMGLEFAMRLAYIYKLD